MASPLFGFVQLEFGFLLGPGDGRYMVRDDPGQEPETVLVLSTLAAPQRRRVRGRKGKVVEGGASPEAVPTSRATVVRTEPFATPDHAEVWLSAVRDDAERRDGELDRALWTLNSALHAYRVSRADPHVRDVAVHQTLVARIGFGSGDDAVAGMFRQAWELPHGGVARAKRSMEAPEERFAALLSGRESVLACEELVLRTRMDLAAGRGREAALQARVGLEALLAELPALAADRRGELEADRAAIGDAANAALRGELPDELAEALEASVKRMESALRTRRLGSAS